MRECRCLLPAADCGPGEGAGSSLARALNPAASDDRDQPNTAGGQGVSALATINPTTGVITDGPTINLGTAVQIRGMAFSSTDVLYATNQPVVGSFAPPNELYRINTNTGVGTYIASLNGSIQALAFSPSGVLYGWNTGSGELMRQVS